MSRLINWEILKMSNSETKNCCIQLLDPDPRAKNVFV